MTLRHALAACLLSLVLAGAAVAQGGPGWDASAGTAGLTPLPVGGALTAEATWAPLTGPRGVARLTFANADSDRRFVGYALELPEGIAGARSLEVVHRYTPGAGPRPQLAVVLFDDRGGAWMSACREALSSEGLASVAIGLSAPAETTFSQAGGEPIDLARVRRAWLGLVLEGEVEGVLDLDAARFSPEPWRPAHPVSLMPAAAADWSTGTDPAVTWTLSYVDEGPDGERCMRFDFEMPGGRHMYATPSFALPIAALDGYAGLRMTYRATLPRGITGLLHMVGEQGAQFYADPAPPAAEEWRTLEVPFGAFALGGWTKDANGTLDLARADRLFCGLHGTAQGDVVRGTIWVRSIEAMP